MRKILVTGGAGFIGSHFIRYMLDQYTDYSIVNIDNLSFAANFDNMLSFSQHSRFEFIQADINQQEIIEHILAQHAIDAIFHFAAESHVDRSISDPDSFIQSNVVGTYRLLCAAKNCWRSSRSYHRHCFVHISTDEVYGALGEEGAFTEQSQYLPNSPYSASKASSDLLVRSFHKTYGLNAIVTHCSNNYGSHQHVEKLIPTVIRSALQEQPIPVYGQGKQVRDWLYVLDHCRAIDTIFQQAKEFDVVNIGGGCELSNIELVGKLCAILDRLRPRSNGSYADLISFVDDRPGHDFRYAIDNRYIQQQYGWQPEYTFDTALEETVKWYLSALVVKPPVDQQAASHTT